MDFDLEPGTYVVAVSGGVDSMALLHALHHRPDVHLVVAHFDHGIRADSELDRRHVQRTAGDYGVPFIYDRAELGSDASEDTARRARYAFLHRVRSASGAKAVITAHHRDDALETAILQLIRGTGRRGITALGSQLGVRRPLLGVSKADIRAYAQDQGLTWREDATNQDTRYLRNRVRHDLLPKLNQQQLQRLHELVSSMRIVNAEIDQLLDLTLHLQPSQSSLGRQWFVSLPHGVAREVMAHWLRRHGLRGFDKKQLEKLVVAAKTLAPGQQTDIDKGHVILVGKDILALMPRER